VGDWREYRINWDAVGALAQNKNPLIESRPLYKRFMEAQVAKKDGKPACLMVCRVHVAVLVRFHAYNVLGPKAEDETYCAMADLLLRAHAHAWNQSHETNGLDPVPYLAQEIIAAPDTNPLAYLRGCAYLERQCELWPGWETSPACAFLHEMQLGAIRLLPGWADTIEHFTPEATKRMKNPGLLDAKWLDAKWVGRDEYPREEE
jgi:hypothetical protein